VNKVNHGRRTFLQMTAGAAASAPLFGLAGRALARPSDFDPSFGTATEAMAALERRRISSRELMAHVFARIARINPSLNAFVTLLEEQAMLAAAAADEARMRGGRALGRLHGLPVLMKDVFMTAGVRTTSGSLQYKDYVPTEDAAVVARMKRAGAIIIGKTNTPELALDWQTFNEVAGQTNNPWDLTRTPGGSTGGGAAALATGMGFLETGSDMGGSLRTPAHFTGVYGHKPSLDLVPTFGHIMPPPTSQLWTNPLVVMGPLARSADDLALSLLAIAGPEQAALRWTLPAPRKTRLSEYRIGCMLDDPFCAVDPEVKEVLQQAVDALRGAGVQVVEGWPEGVSLPASFDLYLFMAGGLQGNAVSPEQRAQFNELVRQGNTQDPYILGVTASHYEYTLKDQQRLIQRARWQHYFRSFDAFLCPVHFIPAFPHDHRLPRNTRSLVTSDGSTRAYNENMKWVSPATLAGLPATAAPVGFTRRGLPVGIQIIGPYYEDGTPIDVARGLTELVGGFARPPAYAN